MKDIEDANALLTAVRMVLPFEIDVQEPEDMGWLCNRTIPPRKLGKASVLVIAAQKYRWKTNEFNHCSLSVFVCHDGLHSLTIVRNTATRYPFWQNEKKMERNALSPWKYIYNGVFDAEAREEILLLVQAIAGPNAVEKPACKNSHYQFTMHPKQELRHGARTD